MDEKKGTAPEMTFRKALFGFLIPLAIVLSIVLTGNDVFIALFLAMTVLIVYGLAIGFKFDFLLQAILDGASSIMGAVLIMLMVGMLVAVWMLCGSVPSMLYYGLKIINPQFFLPISFIICIITSTATGSSWGTAGTMGVALMGVAAGMACHCLWLPDALSPVLMLETSFRRCPIQRYLPLQAPAQSFSTTSHQCSIQQFRDLFFA